MPILDLEMQQRELGRIRIGDQVPAKEPGKTRPHKLDKFRFTSANPELIDSIAGLYGGKPRPWNNDGKAEFEVYSETARVPILVPPKNLTQWYELHTAAGCLRRCDGFTNIVDDTPCKCPKNGLERALAAQSGKACKPTTRLNVVLPDVPGIGVWRIDSHGYHSAVKLPMVAELLAFAAGERRYIPAHLTLVLQTSKQPGQGRREWYVPLIDVGASPRELMAGSSAAGIAGDPRASLAGGQRAIEAAAKPPAPVTDDPGDDHWIGRVADAQTLEALTQVLGEAQAAGRARDGDPLFGHFAKRRREIQQSAAPTEQGAEQSEVVDAEIVEDDPAAENPALDRLWFQITENAPGEWSTERLSDEFAKRNGGTLPVSATEQQLGAFLQWLRNGGAR